MDNELEKLKHLLQHWVEHTEEHNEKYLEWVDKIKDLRPDVAETLLKAVKKFRKGEELLKEAADMLGS
jgi:DNA gyrase/topoisomerase IV subunit A